MSSPELFKWTRRHWLYCAGLALAAAACRSSGGEVVIVCPRCGREAGPEASFCSHCGAAIETEPGPTELDEPIEVNGEDPGLEPAALRDFNAAQHARENGRPMLALLLARHAAVLAAVADNDGLRADSIELRSEVTRKLRFSERRCPLCDGDGRRRRLAMDMLGASRRIVTTAGGCPLCGGRGQITFHRSGDDLRVMHARALPIFRADRERLGWHNLGGVWLPQEIAASIDIFEQVRLLHAARAPCHECLGFGYGGCTACRGAGRTPCVNDECVMGMTVCPDCDGRGRGRTREGGSTALLRCNRCSGAGIVQCEDCGGRGWLDCRACDGRERTVCNRCRGSGVREECRSCKGSGLEPCRACDRGARDAEHCPECGGRGKSLCSRCQGDGYRR